MGDRLRGQASEGMRTGDRDSLLEPIQRDPRLELGQTILYRGVHAVCISVVLPLSSQPLKNGYRDASVQMGMQLGLGQRAQE